MTRWKEVLQNEFSDFYELIPCKILMVLCILRNIEEVLLSSQKADQLVEEPVLVDEV